jgi:hypothetical protein
MLLAAGILGVYLALGKRQPRLVPVAQYAAGLAPCVAVWGAFNWWRFGNPIESGYLRDTTPGYGHSIVAGGLGLLFSPYASVFLYCPVALLSLAGLRALHRRHGRVAWLLATLFVAFFLLYASLGNWMGGRAYGPRYLVPVLPALVLPLAFWVPGPLARRAACLVLALSVVVQVPGVLVDYSKVRITRAAAGETVAQDLRWRGMPLWLNVRAAVTNTRIAVNALVRGEPPPSRAAQAGTPDLGRSLDFSLDLWWLYLFYMHAIGRAAALAIAGLLATGCGLSFRRARTLAVRCQESG